MTKMYELYYCIYKGEVVYIGQGAKGRHTHCNSGCSHVYGLNEIHFREGTDALETKVVLMGRDKEKMVELEREHILTLRPKFNSQYLKRRVENPQTVVENMNMKKDLLEYPKIHAGKKEGDIFVQKYKNLCYEFLEFHSVQDIRDKNILMFKRSTYGKFGAKYLESLIRNIKYRSGLSGYCTIFCEAMKEIFDIDLESPEYHIQEDRTKIVAKISVESFKT